MKWRTLSQRPNSAGVLQPTERLWKLEQSLRRAILFIILFVHKFGRVCLQFSVSVRNSVEVRLIEKRYPSPSWFGGGGTKIVNKLAFPNLFTESSLHRKICCGSRMVCDGLYHARLFVCYTLRVSQLCLQRSTEH